MPETSEPVQLGWYRSGQKGIGQGNSLELQKLANLGGNGAAERSRGERAGMLWLVVVGCGSLS